jgi:hypothetical protein
MMFMEHLMSGITMHKPLVPPRVVLTLGNGSDFWALRAAEEWPVCIQQRQTSKNIIFNLLTSFAAMPSHGA